MIIVWKKLVINQIMSMARLREEGTRTDRGLSVPIVSESGENEEYIETGPKEECLGRLNTSVAQLSEEETDTNMKI